MVEKTFTFYYLIILAILILLNLICPFLKIYWYFAFSIKQIKENHQYWRLFTNYLIKPTKKVNIGTLISLVSIYTHLHNLEIRAQQKDRYSKFIMTILIFCALNILLTYLFFYFFEVKESRCLLNELYYSISAMGAYKRPHDKSFIGPVPIKQRFVPIALIIMEIYYEKDISLEILKTPLIGIISGIIFCLVTKKLKFKYIPNILKRILKEPTDEERKVRKEARILFEKRMKEIQKNIRSFIPKTSMYTKTNNMEEQSYNNIYSKYFGGNIINGLDDNKYENIQNEENSDNINDQGSDGGDYNDDEIKENINNDDEPEEYLEDIKDKKDDIEDVEKENYENINKENLDNLKNLKKAEEKLKFELNLNIQKERNEPNIGKDELNIQKNKINHKNEIHEKVD